MELFFWFGGASRRLDYIQREGILRIKYICIARKSLNHCDLVRLPTITMATLGLVYVRLSSWVGLQYYASDATRVMKGVCRRQSWEIRDVVVSHTFPESCQFCEENKKTIC